MLAGAKFHIEDSKGKIVGELVTNEEGEVISKDLPKGNYTLVEVEAPKGYEFPFGKSFDITSPSSFVTSSPTIFPFESSI
jgi:uncharacterized surface anchored protein